MSTVTKYDPPRDTVETDIAAIWAQQLGKTRVGIYDPFTALGGHSLQATEVVTQVARQFGLRNVNQDLLRLGTVAEQAEFVRAKLG